MVTQSPFINKFIKHFSNYLKGKMSKEEFSDRISHLKYFFKQLKELYEKEIKYQEKTQEFLNYLKELENNFSLFDSAIKDIELYFNKDLKEKIPNGIDKLVVAIDNIFDILDKVQQYHIKDDIKVSKSPYVNELYRLLYKVKSDKLDLSVIKSRVSEYLPRYKRALEDVKDLSERKLPEFYELKEYYNNSIEQLVIITESFSEILQTNRIEIIEELLYKIHNSSEMLIEIQEKIKENFYNKTAQHQRLKFFAEKIEFS